MHTFSTDFAIKLLETLLARQSHLGFGKCCEQAMRIAKEIDRLIPGLDSTAREQRYIARRAAIALVSSKELTCADLGDVAPQAFEIAIDFGTRLENIPEGIPLANSTNTKIEEWLEKECSESDRVFFSNRFGDILFQLAFLQGHITHTGKSINEVGQQRLSAIESLIARFKESCQSFSEKQF